jgi:aquaporin Z
MSINPARSVASALPSGTWTGFWIYLVAPLLGMLVAAEVYAATAHRVICAKLNHEGPDDGGRCIFRCGYCRHDAPTA